MIVLRGLPESRFRPVKHDPEMLPIYAKMLACFSTRQALQKRQTENIPIFAGKEREDTGHVLPLLPIRDFAIRGWTMIHLFAHLISTHHIPAFLTEPFIQHTLAHTQGKRIQPVRLSDLALADAH
jgi:hypothetical protein